MAIFLVNRFDKMQSIISRSVDISVRATFKDGEAAKLHNGESGAVHIARVSIMNFRGIRSATIHFDGTAVLLGDNNTGKSTVLEAIELAIGPDRLARQFPIDEHDFYGGDYLDAEKKPLKIVIEALIVDLAEPQQMRLRNHLEWWDPSLLNLAQKGELPVAAMVGRQAAVRIRFEGVYDPEEDGFQAKTWFASPLSPEGELVSECRSSEKREFGFLYLRALRTGTRALSMERGSLLDVILRLYEVRTDMWESLLKKLRPLDVVGQEHEQFGAILTAIQETLREIVPGEWGEAPHLRVSELTREDLRRVLKSFLATGVGNYAAPFQHQGSGTINALVLSMLTLIAKKKEKQVIFAMEEPEISLPPHVQKRVVDSVRDLASQALFTSHSPYVIEQFEPEQMYALKRTKEGVLTGMKVALPENLKLKTFRDGLRTRFCEALLARHVLVVEGKTEFVGYSVAARKAALHDNETYQRLDTLGWVPFDAGSETNIVRFASFFCDLGKTVATIFDKQSEEKLTIIGAVCHRAFEQPYKGFEDMLCDQVPLAVKQSFLDKLEKDGDWPKSISESPSGVIGLPDEYEKSFSDLFRSNKGGEYLTDLFEHAGVGGIPAFMLETLAELKTMLEPPELPDDDVDMDDYDHPLDIHDLLS